MSGGRSAQNALRNDLRGADFAQGEAMLAPIQRHGPKNGDVKRSGQGRISDGARQPGSEVNASAGPVACESERDSLSSGAKERPGQWTNAREAAMDSMGDIVLESLEAANRWERMAEKSDPPESWEPELGAVAALVLGSALGGLGGALAAVFTRGMAGVMGQAAIQAGVLVGQDTCKAGVDEAIKMAQRGDATNVAIGAFCTIEARALRVAATETREAFRDASGDFEEQLITIAELVDLRTKNEALGTKAAEIQHKEMLIGWMAMNTGKTSEPDTEGSSLDSDIEKNVTGNLRIEINGSEDTARTIRTAKVSGLNKALRGQLAGTKLGEWLVGGERKAGIDVLITTGPANMLGLDFTLGEATWSKAEAAGVVPEEGMTRALRAVYFTLFAARSGSVVYIDGDIDRIDDRYFGADAGRWFLKNIKSVFQIVDELSGLTLPGTIGT